MKIVSLVFSLIILIGTAAMLSACASFGQKPTAEHVNTYEASPQWGGKAFKNELPQAPIRTWEIIKNMIAGGSNYKTPTTDIPLKELTAASFEEAPETGLRVTWLGHSSLFIEMENSNVLIDPVWSERASMFDWMGPKRFHKPVIALNDLPKIDTVIISHDHYDHLDMATVKKLAGVPLRWVVPLGVASHLEHWGIAKEKIVELDWWQSTHVKGLKITATPSRHASGRSVHDYKATLWAGWAIKGQEHNVFYSGDTSMHDEFAKIGKALGPFDLSIIEVGAYNQLWADHHLGPEQAIIAHHQLGAKKMLPVHWGTFDLASHGWTEPIERVMDAADKTKANVITPMIGEPFEPTEEKQFAKWWPDLPWDTAELHPVKSSLVEYDLNDFETFEVAAE